MINETIDYIVFKHIQKLAALNEDIIHNMVGQTLAKDKANKTPEELAKLKEKFIEYSKTFNKIVPELGVDFKSEKLLLIWFLEQISKKEIDEHRINEDLDVLKNNLKFYFNRRKEIENTIFVHTNNTANIFKHTYSDIKDWISIIRAKDEALKEKNKPKEERAESLMDKILGSPYHQSAGYKIYKVTKATDAMKLAQNTHWCVAGESWANKYLKDGPLWFVTKNEKKLALLNFENDQIKDINNADLTKETVYGIITAWPELEEIIIKHYRNGNEGMLNYIKNPSEEMKAEAVKKNGALIKYIENPSEEIQMDAIHSKRGGIEALSYVTFEKVQMEAIKYLGEEHASRLVQHFKNPSEKVQKELVKYGGVEAFKQLKTPSEPLQIEFLKLHPKIIHHIKNLTEKAKLEGLKAMAGLGEGASQKEIDLAAVKKERNCIKYVEDPSEEIQLAAVNQDSFTIQWIKNPTKKVQLEAVRDNPYVIGMILNKPDEEVQIEAVKNNGATIEKIIEMNDGKFPSMDVQLAAVCNNGRAITFLPDANEQVQSEAIKEDRMAINYIKDPSPAVQLECLKLYDGNTKGIKISPEVIKQYKKLKKSHIFWRHVIHGEFNFEKNAANFEKIKEKYGIDITEIISQADIAKINKIIKKAGAKPIVADTLLNNIARRILGKTIHSIGDEIALIQIESRGDGVEYETPINKYFDLVGKDTLIGVEVNIDYIPPHWFNLRPTQRFVEFVKEIRPSLTK